MSNGDGSVWTYCDGGMACEETLQNVPYCHIENDNVKSSKIITKAMFLTYCSLVCAIIIAING